MADRWYYTHEGKTEGPESTAALARLAAAGQLAPTDPVWAEGSPPTSAVPAQAAVPFPKADPPKPAPPDWLSDVQALNKPVAPASPATPEWLEDVRKVEEEAQSTIVPVVEASPTPPPIPNLPVLEIAPGPPAPGEPILEAVPAFPGDGIPVVDVVPVTPARPNQPPPTPPPIPLATPVAARPHGPAAPVARPASGACRLAVGSATNQGMVRERNEDSFLVLQTAWANLDRRHEMAVVVVADGMGGHHGGDRASGLAIAAMAKSLTPLLAEAVRGSLTGAKPALSEALDQAILDAHRSVAESARVDPLCKDMGTTLVALVIRDGEAHIALVGDCRVYHQRGGRLKQVTRDQTLVARMVELGQLSEEEAANHPRRNEITQAVGQRTTVRPAHYDLKLRAGDWLVAACDGLTAHVDDTTLEATISGASPSPADLTQRLVDLANQGGGSDNCTVVAVYCY